MFEPPPVNTCALCGRDLWDVERYVVGAATVCEPCVRDAAAALDLAPAVREVRMPPRAYGEPSPAPVDMEAIQRAYTSGFAGDPTFVEDGAALRPFMEWNSELHPGMRADFVVQRVRLVDADHADVRFFVVVHPDGYRIQLEGRAVRVDDRWCVARETALAILRRGEVPGLPD